MEYYYYYLTVFNNVNGNNIPRLLIIHSDTRTIVFECKTRFFILPLLHHQRA